MPLKNRELKPGTVLVARYKKEDHTCVVMETEDGLRYRVAGTDHKSPSSAAKAVMGGIAANGWRFWSLQGELKPAPAQKTKRSTTMKPPAKSVTKQVAKGKAPAKARKNATKKSTPKKKVAKMESAGAFGCGACGQEFRTMKAATEHALTHTAN